MLAVLRIHNLAIVEHVEFEFNQGLNVLTGETGAGKSIILRALELLAGKRSSADIVRNGAERCEVEALFVLPEAIVDEIQESIDSVGDTIVEGELVIKRIVDVSGRGKVYLNGVLSTIGVLQHLAPLLIDITGQHAQQRLLDEEQHRQLLDEYADHSELLDSVATAYEAFSKAKRALDTFLTDTDARRERMRRISFEHEELSEAALRAGEREELEEQLHRLSNVESLTDAVNESLSVLESDEGGVERSLSRSITLLSRLAGSDTQLREILELLDAARVHVSEARISLTDYAADIQADPEELERLRERVALIARLERKYGKSESELAAYAKEIAAEIAAFESGSFDEDSLRKALDATQQQLKTCEEALTKSRQAAAKKLAKEIEHGLSELNMKKARCNVQIDSTTSSRYGADKIQFLLAANPGEPYRPLQKVASGGELSRVLLTLKSILTAKNAPALQVFDEVDSGIGGAIAQVVGEKLHTISTRGQVLLVTHAAQIAALADVHFYLSKETAAGRTRTSVSKLDQQGRIEEVARMLAGKKVSEKFTDSAKELLGLS